MFAEAGFHQVGALGTSKVVMRRVVRAAAPATGDV